MNFNIKVGVSEISNFSCKMKNLLLFYAKKEDKEIEEFNDFENIMIAGKLIHSLIQEVFKESFDEILFFIYRRRMKPKTAIFETLKIKLNQLAIFLQEIEILSQVYQIDTLLGSLTADDILNLIEPQLDLLSSLSTDLIKVNENGDYYNSLIDNEITIREKFNKNIYLTGKIDLFTIDDTNCINIIELKTGKSDSNVHSNQIKIYGDLLAKNLNIFHPKIKLQLWYSNPQSNRLKKGLSPIKKPNWKKDEILKKLEKNINDATKLTNSKKEIHKRANWYRHNIGCKICGHLCTLDYASLD